MISPSTAALLPGPQRGDRLHAAAVLVAERQPVEQVFDGDEAGALEVRRLARTDAFQELERGVEEIELKAQWRDAAVHNDLAVRRVTRARWQPFGLRLRWLLNDDRLPLTDFDLPDVRRQRERSSRLMPCGCSGVRE